MAVRFERGMVYKAPLKWHQTQHYTPDFKMWAGAIDKQQKDYDTANQALSALRPNALPEWEEARNKYSQGWKDKATGLTDMYINQGVAAGNRMRNKLMRDVQNEITDPGSEYNAFNKQTKNYTDERARLLKFHEKDPVQDNLAFGLNKLESQVEEWDKHYNKDTNSLIKGISDVLATPYQDIASDWRDHVKATKVDGYEVQWMDNKMIYTKSGEGVPIEKANKIFNSFMESSKYKGQLDAYTFSETQGVTPEQYGQSINKTVKSNKDALTEQLETITTELNSKDEEERKTGQARLKQLGYYEGDIDGDVKGLTRTALEKYKKASSRRAEQLGKRNVDPLTMTEEQMKAGVQSGIVEGYRDQFTGLYGYKTSNTMEFRKDYLQNIKDAAANNRLDAYLAKMGPKTQPTSTGLSTNAKPFKIKEFEAKRQEAATNLENAKTTLEKSSKEILTPVLGFNATEDDVYSILNSIKDVSAAASREGVPFDVGSLIQTLAKDDIIIDEAQAKQLVATMTGDAGQALKNNITTIGKVSATLKHYDDYTAGREAVYRKEEGVSSWKKFIGSNKLTKGKTIEEGKEILKFHTGKMVKFDTKYKEIHDKLIKENTTKIIRNGKVVESPPTKAQRLKLISKAREQAAKEVGYATTENTRKELRDYNSFLQQEKINIEEHVASDPEAYKSATNAIYTNADNKSVMKSFSKDLIGAAVVNPAALRGMETQNLKWEDADGKGALPSSAIKMDKGTVGFGVAGGVPFLQISAEKIGESGKIYTTTARIDEINKQDVLDTAKAALLQTYQSNSGDAKVETLSNFIAAIEGTGKDVSEIQAINNAPITDANSALRNFNIGGAKIPYRTANNVVDTRKTEIMVKDDNGNQFKMEVNLNTYAVGEVGGGRNFIVEREYVTPDGTVVKTEAVTLINGEPVPATVMNVKKPSVQAVDKQFKIIEIVNDPRVQRTIDAIPKREIPVESTFNPDNIIPIK